MSPCAREDDFRVFLMRQRKRILGTTSNAVARVQRKIAALEPMPLVEARGLKQPWRRDTPEQQQFTEDDF